VAPARTRLIVPDHVITRVVGGSTVLLDIDTGRSFTLDAVGSRVWSLLAESGSASAAYETLLAEFDVEPDQLRRDLDSLVDQLAAASLLALVEEHA
jgi:hypothetical protein